MTAPPEPPAAATTVVVSASTIAPKAAEKLNPPGPKHVDESESSSDSESEPNARFGGENEEDDEEKAALKNCRLYEEKFPKPEDFVIVKVLSIEELGVYVQLLEYGNLEGLILTSELSKRRFRSITKLVRVGRLEVASVVRVDPAKGYVDLSKKRVAPEDATACENRYAMAKKVHLTARLVASKHNMPLEELLRISIWPLYAKFGHAYDGLRIAIEDREKAFAGIECPVEIQNSLIEDVRMRLQPQAMKLRAGLSLSCTGMQGIVAVKRSLLDAQKTYEEEAASKASSAEAGASASSEMSIQLVASPLYSLILQCYDKGEGMARLQKVLDNVKANISAYPGGEYSQQGAITVIGGEEHAIGKGGEESGSEEEEEEEESSSDEESDEGMGLAPVDDVAVAA